MEQPASEVYAVTDELNRAFVGVLLVTLAGSIAAAVYSSRSMARPIEELGVAVERIGGGDLDYRSRVSGRDEIGRLAEGINRMAFQLKRRETSLKSTIDELETTVNQLTALRKITDAALGTLDLDDMLKRLLERVVEAMGVNGAAIVLIDEGSEELRAKASVGLNEQDAEGFRGKLGQGFCGLVAQENRPVFVLDTQSPESPMAHYVTASGIKSLLGVPLRAKDKVLGVVHVDTKETRRFTMRSCNRSSPASIVWKRPNRTSMGIPSPRSSGRSMRYFRAA